MAEGKGEWDVMDDESEGWKEREDGNVAEEERKGSAVLNEGKE